MKTKQQILKETLEYYHADPSSRAVNKTGGCEYLTDDGRMCAFGRCEIQALHAPSFDSFNKLNERVEGRFHGENDMNETLKGEYRGHSMNFWSSIQHFHDSPRYWNETGVSVCGLNHFNKLMVEFS
jgi:hypothetical protein